MFANRAEAEAFANAWPLRWRSETARAVPRRRIQNVREGDFTATTVVNNGEAFVRFMRTFRGGR